MRLQEFNIGDCFSDGMHYIIIDIVGTSILIQRSDGKFFIFVADAEVNYISEALFIAAELE